MQIANSLSVSSERQYSHVVDAGRRWWIVSSLLCAVGVPVCYYYGDEGEWHVMVIDRLGHSLEDLFNLCKRRFSVETVLHLGIQMVRQVNASFSFEHSSGARETKRAAGARTLPEMRSGDSRLHLSCRSFCSLAQRVVMQAVPCFQWKWGWSELLSQSRRCFSSTGRIIALHVYQLPALQRGRHRRCCHALGFVCAFHVSAV